MFKLFAAAGTALLGLGVAGFVEPSPPPQDDPPPPEKAKVNLEVRKVETPKAEEKEVVQEFEIDPADDLRQTYDLLRRLRAEAGGAHANDRPGEWTSRATRLYRDGVEAYGRGDIGQAHALGAAALQLARAVEFARNAERDERADDGLPPPPAAARYRAFTLQKAKKLDAPSDLPPPLNEKGDDPQTRRRPGGGRFRAVPLLPGGPFPPGAPMPPVPPSLARVPVPDVAFGVHVAAPAENAEEQIRQLQSQIRDLIKEQGTGDSDQAQRELRDKLKELDSKLAETVRSASAAHARRDLRRAYDRIQEARAQDWGPEAKFYLDSARDLYNAARRDAQAGRHERASELARAAEALTLVPRHLAQLSEPAGPQPRAFLRRLPPLPPGPGGLPRHEVRPFRFREKDEGDKEKEDETHRERPRQPSAEGKTTTEPEHEHEARPKSTQPEAKPAEPPAEDGHSLIGIGASLTERDGKVFVGEILPNSPAARDGRLKPGDQLIGVQKDGDDGETIEFEGKPMSEVAHLVRGPRGSKVRLVVRPRESEDRKVYELTRDRIELPRVIDSESDQDGKPNDELPPPLSD